MQTAKRLATISGKQRQTSEWLVANTAISDKYQNGYRQIAASSEWLAANSDK